MALFKVDTQKTDGVRVWSNRYILDAVSLAQAHDSAVNIIAAAEIAMHADFITIDHVRTSTLVPNDNSFLTTATDLAGTLASSGSPLPLWNVVRADMTMSSGRPSRKYLRSGLGSGDIIGGYKWNGTNISAVQLALATMRNDLDEAGTPWVDEQNDAVLSVNTFQPIGMRQLRRGSRRVTTPII